MFDGAVAAGVAAFMAGPEAPSEEQVRATLDGWGVSAWLGQRLVTFLPLAFGRVVLTDVRVSQSYLDGEIERRLVDDPVWMAASLRAQEASRDEVAVIGLRSAEVDAVNTALHNGSDLADLTLGPVALTEPLPPVEPGDGGAPSVRDAFLAMLRGHGVAVSEDGAGPDGYGFDARVFPHPSTAGVILQVDFRVMHPRIASGHIVESFGAAGATWAEATAQALYKFERNSFHPIVAALLDRSQGEDQVEWARWGEFELCLGPQLVLYSDVPAPATGHVLDALLVELRAAGLAAGEVHTFRVFTLHQGGTLTTNEVLVDNQPWPAGEAVTAAAAWDVGDAMVGTRLFGVLVPARPQ